MSQNADRLRTGYERFNRTREYDLNLLAPDFEMHQASSIIDTAGVFHVERRLSMYCVNWKRPSRSSAGKLRS
jgi:hypothetical protein